MRLKKITGLILAGVLSASLLTGCAPKTDVHPGVKLDPGKPVSLTVWHYYNGAQQAAFDELVSDFNATVGKEMGIYVEGTSRGSVADLEEAVTAAAAGEIGADPLPDIFSSYADTAYAVQQDGKLADLTAYFTEEELSAYVDEYIQEGYFNNDGALYLFPVAKSTEIMMINATDWEPFAAAYGYTYDDLKTLEGVVAAAESYYNWTDAQTPDIPDDGKAFYGRDSMSNYFIIGMKQMGTELFSVENGTVTIHADKDKIRRLWNNYYVPYINGWFAGMGKFRSDDVKTGDLLAYTGSSSSATYFPDTVMTDEQTKNISFAVLSAPILEGGEHYNVQQGAGMAVVKSEAAREYASCVFLKWFTKKENSLRFVTESSYLPVVKEANTAEALDEIIAAQKLSVSRKTYDCLVSVMKSFADTTFYTTRCFKNGYATRRVLDYDLSDKAAADKAALDAAVAEGGNRAALIAEYTSAESFDAWYEHLCEVLNEKANG